MTTRYQKPFRVEYVTEGGCHGWQDRCSKESAEEAYHAFARQNADVRILSFKGDKIESVKGVIA